MTTPDRPRVLRSTWLVAVIAAALGATGGFLAGRAKSPAGSSAATSVTSDSSAPERISDASRDASHGSTVSSPSPVAGLKSALDSSAIDRRMADFEALRGREPRAALEVALAEPNRARRERMLEMVLQRWAETAPADALQWALARPAGEREKSLAAVIAGAAAQPAEAVFLVRQLCDAEPGLALERGSALIDALAKKGHFAEAARFANESESAVRTAWTGAAFARWAEWDPAAASRAALELKDSDSRENALRAAITSWAPNEPASLAAFALKLPAGETRAYALGEAMRQWIDSDPVAAAAWVDRFEPSPELDQAVAAIAQQPYLAERKPDVALSWAESIVDRGVRASTLAALVQSWAQRDPAAARRYIESNRDFSAEDRKDLLSALGR